MADIKVGDRVRINVARPEWLDGVTGTIEEVYGPSAKVVLDGSVECFPRPWFNVGVESLEKLD